MELEDFLNSLSSQRFNLFVHPLSGISEREYNEDGTYLDAEQMLTSLREFLMERDKQSMIGI